MVIYDFSGGHIITKYYFNENNRTSVQYTIPQNIDSLNITLIFEGTNQIISYSVLYSFNILPKWEMNFTILSIPESLRIGQSIQYTINGSFVNQSCPISIYGTNIIITYIFEGGEVIIEKIFGNTGSILLDYTIPQDCGNFLNITIEQSGTDRIASFEKTNSLVILPQMQTNLIILDSVEKEDYTGEFHFKVQLIDSEGKGIEQETIFFIIRDKKNNVVITNASVVTNINGIAEISLEFDSIGDYSIEPAYYGKGIYSEAIFATDASFQYDIRVVNLGVKIIDNITIILITLGASILLSASYYRGIVIPRRKKRMKALLAIHQQLEDIENIQYLILIHKKTGVSIFSQSFTEIPIDENLISGFLSAISSFGEEIGGKVKGNKKTAGDIKSIEGPEDIESSGGLEELGYKQFKIVVIEGYYIKTAVLLLKSSSDSLKANIKNFNTKFEQKNLDLLMKWTGKTPPEDPIIKLVEDVLHSDLLYPHNLIESKVASYKKKKKLKKRSIKSLIINEAKDKFNNKFHLREMIIKMAGQRIGDVKTFNAINQLRKDGIVFAVNPRTQFLIEKFKPLIDTLNGDERKVLIEINNGVKETKQIEDNTKIAVVIPVLTKLHTNNFIEDDNSLTETGELIATLLNLIPDI